jgi:hypothetical protein
MTAHWFCPFVEQFTQTEVILYIDAYDSYHRLKCLRHTVCHNVDEWACCKDGDGLHEVHWNFNEDSSAGFRNFLCPFRGIYEAYSSGYAAIYELVLNQKQVFPAFISAIVRSR